MVYHIPLQLCQIHAPPGTEDRRLLAPLHELLHDLLKGPSVPVQLVHGNMGHLGNDIMQLPVHAGADQPVELGYLLHFFVELHSSDLKNLKRQMIQGCFLSCRALVPFQIKYNVITHNTPSITQILPVVNL